MKKLQQHLLRNENATSKQNQTMNGSRTWSLREEYIPICVKRLGCINNALRPGFRERNLSMAVSFPNPFLQLTVFRCDEMVWKPALVYTIAGVQQDGAGVSW